MDTKKIAVATDDKETVAEHLGRANFFTIYTISANDILSQEFIENNFTHHKLHPPSEPGQHEHSGEHHSHKEIINALSGCQVVLSRGMGERIIKALKKAGIRGYVVVEPGTMEEIINKYIEGELIINRDGGCGCSNKKD